MQSPDDQIVAAGDRQALTAGQHMIVRVAAAGHPQGALASHQPSSTGGHPTLRVTHQYTFHDKLLFPVNLHLDDRLESTRGRMKS